MYHSSSSDSSDNAERSKNVHKLLIKSRESERNLDQDYAHKQKLGDLLFDANFEGGNLGAVKQIDQYEYDLSARPDVANPRHKIWFNFRVSNQRRDQCVVFNFVNLSENLRLVSEVRLTPVIRSRRSPNWSRLRGNQVFYYRSPSHNNRRVLSIAFRFTGHDNEHQFALHYPYNLTTLEHFLGRWSVDLKRIAKGNVIQKYPNPLLKVLVFTNSILGKPIYEIGILSRDTEIGSQKPCIIILGRAGANCESASSLVCQGLMDFMLSDDQVAALARHHMNLLVFPMLDPDSIWAGNSRTDLMGQQPADDKLVVNINPKLYKNFHLARERIEMIQSRATKPVIIIDIRTNQNLIGSRVVGTHYPDSFRMERHLHLPRLLSRFSDGFYLERCEFVTVQPDTNVNNEFYRLEVSPFGYHERSLVTDRYQEYDQFKYTNISHVDLLLGKSMVYALLELNRPKSESMPETVSSFNPTSRDVDDLVLNNIE